MKAHRKYLRVCMIGTLIFVQLASPADARKRREVDQVDMQAPPSSSQQSDEDNTQSEKKSSKKSKASKKTKHLWDYKTQHFNMYSVRQEIDMGTFYMDQQVKIAGKKNWPVDPPQYAATKKRIEAIVQKLAKVSDMPMLPFEVHVIDRKEIVNAYCLPGGKIAVFTGLFDKEKGLVDEKSDDELAAVLGHEMAHATMRHVTRRLTTYNSVGLIGSLVSLGVSRGAGSDWGQLTNSLFNVGTSLYAPSYSRKYESEADQVGFLYMIKAGYDPQAAIRIWERAAQRNKSKGKRDKTSFFDSHPAGGERAETLRGYLADVDAIKQRSKMIEEMRKD